MICGIELLVRESAPAAGGRQAPDEQAARMVRAFAQALQGFERGEIALGARKRRGFGQCRVAAWQVKRYDLRQPGALLAWLSGDRHGKATFDSKSQDSERSIVDLLPGAANPNLDDKRAFCTLTATFQLEGSLLIRSGGDQPNAPDMVHLKSLRGSGAVPVLSGSSLAGALRARALRIAKTVGDPVQAEKVIACLFGALETASRIWVEESEIHDPIERVVTRLKIDRFTGGAYPNALFSQQPLYSGEETRTTIKLRVEDPNDADIGIILLLLKDLWTGDLAVGGEASVGRGRLCGKHAELHLTRPKSGQAENMADIAAEGADQSSPTSWSWVFRRSSTGGLNLPDDAARLQKFVNTFLNEVQDEHA
ncbi:MAG: hypothetical protein IPM07_23785 [Anaerolineales bacterium]|nr:hypothetical protein [Anaerolineales bacterium]